MGTLLLVFQNLARLRIHSDFVHGTTALDVEGVTESAAALLPFQFFVGDSSGPSLQSDGAGLSMLTLAPFASFSPLYANTRLDGMDIKPTRITPNAAEINLIIAVLLS